MKTDSKLSFGFAITGFALLVLSSQAIWVTFSPITTYAANSFHASIVDVGYIAAMFPIVYIILAIPSGIALDSFFKRSLLIGVALNGFAGMGRLIDPLSFNFIFTTEIIGAAAQPFILSAIPLFAHRYFHEKQRVTAVSLAGIAIYTGIVVAEAVGYPLFQVGGLVLLEEVIAIITAVATVWSLAVLFTLEELNTTESVRASLQLKGLLQTLKGKQIWILGGLLAVGLGVFDSLSSWLQPIFTSFGLGNLTGSLLGVMIFSGIVGTAIIPQIASRKEKRTPILMLTTVVTAGTFLAVALYHDVFWVSAWLILDGFLLLSAWPIIFEWIQKFFKPKEQGQVTGFIMLIGHAFGIGVLVTMGEFISLPRISLLFLTAVAIVGLILTFGIPRNV